MRPIPSTVAEAERLGTDPRRGLSLAQVEASRSRHGENRLPELRGRSFLQMVRSALTDKTILVLMGAAMVALLVEWGMGRVDPSYAPHYVDGLAIWVAVLVATLVTAGNEARAAKEFASLARERDDIPVKALREGEVRKISVTELVVGDLVFIESGDKVPADGLALTSVDLEVDQSMLTGESEAVAKGASDPALQAGSIVTGGNGSFLVTAVGEGSELGRIHKTLAAPEEGETPLQERLSALADRIGLFGLAAALLTFSALSISAFARGELQDAAWLEIARALLQYLIVAVTIIVVAVPEGLPVAVTISLAYSVRKMARDKSLVRHLQSCETMGAATVVCSDKTGTLTENRMTVSRCHVGGEEAELTALPESLRATLLRSVAINSTAFLEHGPGGELRYVGSPTEGALLAWAAAHGADWRALRAEADVVHQLGFTSDRKRMSTVLRDPQGLLVYVKGAPEAILEQSSALMTRSGPRPIQAEERAALERELTEISRSGRRTLALAERRLRADQAELGPGELETELTLLALVGIHDPVRKEVKDAVRAARGAGVDVKMVTGDNRHIAEAIARELELLGEGDLVLEGGEFRARTDEELRPLLGRLRVLARSVPTDKHRLVELLQGQGEVVAVTGDGTNDAPALKRADVGFAMGITGTEVAKEASDIIILDDNFATIVKAIRWGRAIFENIRKFLQFQLTVNVAALLTAFLAAVFGFGVPLNSVQLLWVNLIMDSLAALALAVEPPSERLLLQPPHGRTAPLITRPMWWSIFATGGYMVLVLMLALWTDWLVPGEVPKAQRMTFIFNAFVMMQLANELNARSTRFDRGVLEGLSESRLFVVVIVLTFGLQIVIVEWGGAFFRTVPLDLELWGRSVAVGATVLVFGALLRAVGRRRSGSGEDGQGVRLER